MAVIPVSILALMTALVAVLGFFGLGLLVVPRAFPYRRLAFTFLLLVFICTLLSIRTWLAWTWLPWSIWCLLLIGFLKFWQTHKAKVLAPFKTTLRPEIFWFPTCIALVLSLVLVCEELWVALPLYRYDQWTYHLVISKWVDLLETLKGPVTIDHVFFTGGYEFLGLLARCLWSDDAFQQGFQNCFTSLFICFFAGQLATCQRHDSRLSFAIFVSFASAIIFGAGDHEAISSAKPDFVLMMNGMLILSAILWPKIRGELTPVVFGALIAAGFAFKITWIHLASAVIPVAVVQVWFSDGFRGAFSLCLGGLSGGLLSVPMLLKNYQFFNNPLHPGQSFLWSSRIWNQDYAEYWQKISEKPLTLKEFIWNFAEIFLSIPYRMPAIATASILLGVVLLKDRRTRGLSNEEADDARVSWPAMIVFLFLYALIWGLFFGAQISQRFVMGIPALGGVLLLWLVSRSRRRPHLLLLALTIPFFMEGQFEVTLKKITMGFNKKLSAYHDMFTNSPPSFNLDLREISHHRSKIFSGTSYDEATLVSDQIWNFYGSSAFYDAQSPVTFVLLSQDKSYVQTGCALEFLMRRNIRYFWLQDQSTLANWPKAIVALFEQLESFKVRHGTVWFIRDYKTIDCMKVTGRG